MAKIKFGAMINDARGSVDGIVYSKNQYGGYARVKTSPVQPRSDYQVAARAIFGGLSTAFSNTLSDAQRAAWKLFAANNPTTDVFGNSQTLTALAMFQSVNAVLLHADGVMILDPPANMDVTSLLSATVTAAAGVPAFGVAFTATPLGANHKLYVYATEPLPGGVTFIQGRLKFLGAGPAADASPTSFLTEYNARYGTLIAGQKIGVLVCTMNTDNGAVSVGIQSIITVGA